MSPACTSSPNAANEKKTKKKNQNRNYKNAFFKLFFVRVVVLATISAAAHDDVYFPILHWAEEIKQNSAFVLIEWEYS